MHYSISGKGKAIVLIHGFIEEGYMWAALAKKLAASYKVLVPDLPGFGNSPLTTGKVSMPYFAEAIYKMLHKEGIKDCVMLGHSMGGYVSLEFARKHSDMLSGFGLVNSHCFADTEEKKNNRVKGNDFIKRHGSGPFVRELYPALFHEKFQKKAANKKLIQTLTEKAALYAPEALIAANTAMKDRRDNAAVLRESKVPVLLISGRQDESVPLAHSLKQALLANNTDFVLFDNCKHMAVFEYEHETYRAIKRFADSCYGR